jgi:hypothetical protein
MLSLVELPEGVMPLFLATQTQQIFACVADNHVTEENPFKLLKKEDVINDMFNRGAVSDFSPIKKIINVRIASQMQLFFFEFVRRQFLFTFGAINCLGIPGLRDSHWF